MFRCIAMESGPKSSRPSSSPGISSRSVSIISHHRPPELIAVRTKPDSGIPCDLLLLRGTAIVNEAMLSGESTPLLKESIELREGEDRLDMNGADRNSILFSGTKALQVESTGHKEGGIKSEFRRAEPRERRLTHSARRWLPRRGTPHGLWYDPGTARAHNDLFARARVCKQFRELFVYRFLAHFRHCRLGLCLDQG